MVIADCPTSGENKLGQMSYHEGFASAAEAMPESGLSRRDGYWTVLIKRPKEGKQVSAREIKDYFPYLDREIALLTPPVIVLLGSGTVRHFIPDFKGKASAAASEVVLWRPAFLDRSKSHPLRTTGCFDRQPWRLRSGVRTPALAGLRVQAEAAKRLARLQVG